ncbi:Lactamase_B domain-containing protein [Gammaproteobacteria bacterium]
MSMYIAQSEISSLSDIKNASRAGLIFVFVGVGSAFAKKNSQTSLIIAKDGVVLLVDIGTTIPTALAKKGIKVTDFDYYHITHSHADHIGGVEELLLLSRYMTHRKPKIIITEIYQHLLWENSLKGGSGYNEVGPLNFPDLAEPIRPVWVKAQPRETYRIDLAGLQLAIYRTMHIPSSARGWENSFWSTGLLVDNKVLFTADTRFDERLFEDIDITGVETIFHDCQLFAPETVHATYDQLKTLPVTLRNKMVLTHYGDNSTDYDPVADGFVGFAQPWICYSW